MSTADELKDQGIKQFMQEHYQRAADIFRQAVDAYEAENKADMAAEMRVNLGLSLHSLNKHEEALVEMAKGHAVFAQMNDKLRTAQALGNMARVYARLDNTEQALTNYREASSIFIELGDEENYGQTVLAIADLQMRSGNMMQAASTFEIGLDYIKQPNARQRIMRKLLSVRDKMTGTSLPPKQDAPPDDNE